MHCLFSLYVAADFYRLLLWASNQAFVLFYHQSQALDTIMKHLQISPEKR